MHCPPIFLSAIESGLAGEEVIWLTRQCQYLLGMLLMNVCVGRLTSSIPTAYSKLILRKVSMLCAPSDRLRLHSVGVELYRSFTGPACSME